VRGPLVAVDIGGSKIALLARQGLDGADLLADKIRTPRDSTVKTVLSLIDAFVGGVPGRRIAAIGVAVPGHVDERGHVRRAGNLRNWRDVPLKKLLEKRYRAPAFVEGDANCGALGEKWRGAAREMDDFVFLALGTGVGAGIVLDGTIHRGVHAAAGETGDLVIRGTTVSEVVGKRSIQKAARKAIGKRLRSADALRRAESDPRLEKATRDAVESLATSVTALWSILDPEAIILGGGTSKAGQPLLRQIRRRVAPLKPRLLLAALGSQAQLYGALWGAGQVAG
jgi:glucokinase